MPSPGARKGIKIGPLLSVQADKTQPIDEAGAGDIVAVAKTEDLHTGTSLGEVELPPIKFPTPMVGLAVAPKTRGDEAKLSGALHKIIEEDRTVHLRARRRDQGNGAHRHERAAPACCSASGSSAATRSRSKRKEPKIPYRETIQTNAEGSYRHKKQSGGSGQFGEVHIRMYPFPEGTKPEDFATKERFPHLKIDALPREEQFPVGRHGRRRHDSQQLPAGDRKGLSGEDRHAASSPATRCRTSASRSTSARTIRSTRTKRRSGSPAGRRFATCFKRGPAGPAWSRS